MGKLGRMLGLAKKGKIGLSMEKSSYIAGELVRGTIYVDLHEPVECDALVLKVTGKEKVSYTQVRREFQDGEEQVQRDQEEHDKDFFKEKLVIFKTEDVNYAPGKYMYPFEYQLPAHLPGACRLSGFSEGDIEELTAKVKYKFKATLDVDGFLAKDLKADCDLVVHERNFQALAASEDSTTQDVRFLCCLNRGQCQLAVAMDKSIYFSGETANIQCNVTNDSQVDISAMRCRLYQDVTVTLRGGEHRTFTRQMCENEFPGVAAGSTLQQPQPLTLVGDQGGVLTPTATGELVVCNYRIDVECDIPWCPDVYLHLPVAIIAPELPAAGSSWIPESTADFVQLEV